LAQNAAIAVNSGTYCPIASSFDLAAATALFDQVPDVVFFAKDHGGRYIAVNQALVERCGLRSKEELLGREVHNIFPPDLAREFSRQDGEVIRTGRAISQKLELHWFPRRRAGWCLTTKLPLRAADGRIVGLAGISRDLRVPGGGLQIPVGLAKALDYLSEHYGESLSPASLAARAGLAPVRCARLIKRLFGVTPGQLITQTRLAASERRLIETPGSVAEIALACGFYDHSAFTRAFKAATGITPTEYRRHTAQVR
jgi:PAS domain S-box-containing protein